MLLEIIDFINKGGVISWCLFAFYIVIMSISLERLIFFIRSRVNFDKVNISLQKVINNKNISLLENDSNLLKYKNNQSVKLLNYCCHWDSDTSGIVERDEYMFFTLNRITLSPWEDSGTYSSASCLVLPRTEQDRSMSLNRRVAATFPCLTSSFFKLISKTLCTTTLLFLVL